MQATGGSSVLDANTQSAGPMHAVPTVVPTLPEPFKELQASVPRIPLFNTYTGVAAAEGGDGDHTVDPAGTLPAADVVAQPMTQSDKLKRVFTSTPMLYVYTFVAVFLLSFILMICIRPRFLYTSSSDELEQERFSDGKAAAAAAIAVAVTAVIAAILAIVMNRSQQPSKSRSSRPSKHASSGTRSSGRAVRNAR